MENANTNLSLREIKEKLKRNQIRVSERCGVSAMQVSRILNGSDKCSPRTFDLVIKTALSVIAELEGNSTVDSTKSPIAPKLNPEILAYIEITCEKTSQKTARETARMLGADSLIITRSEAISRYFKGKESRYEYHMKKNPQVRFSKGEGRNATVYINRMDLEKSLENATIYC